jgi:hypothetical protein
MQRLSKAVAAASLIAAVAIFSAPALADRPGGPANIRAYACGKQLSERPAICVVFDNHASEEVRFLTELKIDGQPVDAGELRNNVECLNERSPPTAEQLRPYCAKREEVAWGNSCKPPLWMTRPTHDCIAQRSIMFGPTSSRTGTTHGKTGDLAEDGWGVQPEGIMVTNVPPGSTYCFRFAAIRASDGMWSEKWTDWACATARPLPPKPAAVRNIKIQCLPPEWSGSSQDKPLPYRAVITWEGGESTAKYVVTVDGKTYDVSANGKVGPQELSIEIPKEEMEKCKTAEICATNVVGETCTKTLNEAPPYLGYVDRGAPRSAGALEPEQPKIKPGGGSSAADAIFATMPCEGGTVVDGACRCKPGEVPKRFSDRNVCVPGLASPSGGGGGGGGGSASTFPAGCTGGRMGVPPDCHCPNGTQWTGRACLALAATPPSDPCGPGLVLYQGRCVQPVTPQPKVFDFGGIIDWGRRPPRPPVTGGGTDGVQRPGSAGPAPKPLPTPAAPPPLQQSGGGTLNSGGSRAADALRCPPPRSIRNGVCACPIGYSGPNCENDFTTR